MLTADEIETRLHEINMPLHVENGGVYPGLPLQGMHEGLNAGSDSRNPTRPTQQCVTGSQR
jgi:hypothetical protein